MCLVFGLFGFGACFSTDALGLFGLYLKQTNEPAILSEASTVGGGLRPG